MSEKSVILICHRLADRAGTTTQAIRLATALSSENYNVFLIGEGYIDLPGVKVLSLPSTSNPIQFQQNVISILKYEAIHKKRVTILQAFDPFFTGPAVLRVSKMVEATTVLRIGAVYEDFYASRLISKLGLRAQTSIRLFFSRLLKIYLIKILSAFDKVYANCDFLSEHYYKVVKERKKVFSIPNIIELNHKKAVKNFSQNGLNVLYVGRIETRKNIDDLLVGLARSSEKITFNKITLVGSMDKEPYYAKSVQNLARKLAPEIGEVEFLGFVTGDKLDKQYLKHDITIFPTNDRHFPITEGMPNVIIESLSLGTPVIATAVAGVPQIFDPELNEFLIDQNNVIDGIAEKLIWFNSLSNSDKMKLSEKSQKQVKRYNEENIINLYYEMLTENS